MCVTAAYCPHAQGGETVSRSSLGESGWQDQLKRCSADLGEMNHMQIFSIMTDFNVTKYLIVIVKHSVMIDTVRDITLD